MPSNKKQKHICHVVEATATGTLSMVTLLAQQQILRGHSVTIVYSRRPETPEKIEECFPLEANLQCIPMHGLRNWPRAIARLRSALGTLRPDAIFLHSSFAGFLGRVATYHILGSCKIFYIPHCISFMRGDLGIVKKSVFIALEKVASVRAATYLACSESERTCIERSLPGSHCVLIENAVPKLMRSGSICKTRPRTVINAGQIRLQKNPALFAEIAQKAKSENLPLHFLWLGDGEPKMRMQLEASGVEVTGWRTREQVIDELQSASAFLSTSQWEGLPVALIEAQMAQIPTFASACSGNRDCIDHGSTGWLYQDADEAIKLLRKITEDPIQLAAIAQRAQHLASHRFSAQRYGQQMEDLLNASA
ncbi:hypothetical protein ABB27_18360 [Stenotrophomonas terrae]|uniref:Glycosyltransferase subfamily 4-like N-terminal domain-containing protein n=1 Tax=Stenotrophomonas terrae TaxID=405446 RepID=A0A0R0C812_9GAMM|nr:glycosyltransferase [Stenotrophomonas terrae]KRG62247.1 hypothetical protein ABB27_18360 [Stenotrophomonas terrae]